MPELKVVYKAKDYVFYQDADGYYGVAKQDEKPPKHCGYKSLLTLAKLKGVLIYGYVF
jgi:hypothetical protein